MTALGVTSLTDFILAAEGFFLCGLLVAQPKARYSAAWYWQVALLMLAVGAFLGGVDHGFFQIAGDTHSRKMMQHATWVVLGVLTAATLLTIARQFLPPARSRAAGLVAAVQFILYLAAIPLVDNYAVVVANYAPVMLWALVCNVRGLRDGTGSWAMILGIGIAVAASAAQAAGWRLSATIDRNGLYHLGMMVAVLLSYRGGLQLSGMSGNSSPIVPVDPTTKGRP